MNAEEEKLAREAITYIKSNTDLLIEKFANNSLFPSFDNPASVFMAGSPGAGKTEFSKQLIDKFRKDMGTTVVRIDADDIRNMLPGYSGQNAFVFQGAASIGVDKLHDYVLKHKKNFILDGMFANYPRGRENIKRSLDKGRPIVIYYIYQDPIVAWGFTKKRETLEGRRVSKKAFIEGFFESRNVVNKIKVEFGNAIEVDLVMKDFEANTDRTQLNIDIIDNYLKLSYTKEQLENLLT